MLSSVVEHYLHTVGVAGSKPAARTIFPNEIGGFTSADTVSTQKSQEICDEDMSKWPKKVKHRNKVLAKIYKPCKGRVSYRVVWKAAGSRQMKSFRTYSGKGGAKEYAESWVKKLADSDSKIDQLTNDQSKDALAAFERLNQFRVDTGRKLSLLAAVSQLCDVATKLGEQHTPAEAADGFLRTCATVKQKDLAEAINELITKRAGESKELNKNGRPNLHPRWHSTTARWLREFGEMFPGDLVGDLTREKLALWVQSLTKLGGKSRNDHREMLRHFLRWAVRQDYLHQTHRLLDADCMKAENVDTSENDFYRPKELRRLLDGADKGLRPVIALQALAGLRRDEVMRLNWEDVFATTRHITVSSSKSKTRNRRLVEIVPALAAWLRPYRRKQGAIFPDGADVYNHGFAALREALAVPGRKNGLRHGFCTFHFAQHSNENLTAAQAGNSPTMVHAHYKGLTTKKEALAWFAVKPAKTTASEKIVEMPTAQEGVA